MEADTSTVAAASPPPPSRWREEPRRGSGGNFKSAPLPSFDSSSAIRALIRQGKRRRLPYRRSLLVARSVAEENRRGESGGGRKERENIESDICQRGSDAGGGGILDSFENECCSLAFFL